MRELHGVLQRKRKNRGTSNVSSRWMIKCVCVESRKKGKQINEAGRKVSKSQVMKRQGRNGKKNIIMEKSEREIRKWEGSLEIEKNTK